MNIIKLTRAGKTVLVIMDNVTNISKEIGGSGSEIEFISRNSGATMGSQYMEKWSHGRCYVDQTADEIYELCLGLK